MAAEEDIPSTDAAQAAPPSPEVSPDVELLVTELKGSGAPVESSER